MKKFKTFLKNNLNNLHLQEIALDRSIFTVELFFDFFTSIVCVKQTFAALKIRLILRALFFPLNLTSLNANHRTLLQFYNVAVETSISPARNSFHSSHAMLFFPSQSLFRPCIV
jgi:hypothetical protein